MDLAQQSWVIRKNSRTQDAAWRGAAAQGDDTGDAVTHLHRLGSVSEEVKKAVTQGVLKPRGANLLTKYCGMMVLNAEKTFAHVRSSLLDVVGMASTMEHFGR